MAQDPSASARSLVRAAAFAWQGRWEEAVAVYRLWLTDRPADRAAREQLAYALARAGQLAASLAEYRRLAEDEPERYAERIAELASALGLASAPPAEPADERPFGHLDAQADPAALGRSFLAAGQVLAALDEGYRLVADRPDDLAAHFLLAEAYAARGDTRTAAEKYETIAATCRLRGDEAGARAATAGLAAIGAKP